MECVTDHSTAECPMKPQASAAQSAPAGGREACSECNGLGFGPFGGCGECCGSGQASWQRTQAAGVPVGWQFYQDGKWWNGDDRIRDHRANTEAAGYPVRDVYAAAPAQPAAHDQGEVHSRERWTVMCGHWQDTTLAIHGERTGHIASGIDEDAAHAIVNAHNQGLPPIAAASTGQEV